MSTSDLIGKRYGRYVILEAHARVGNNRPCLCRCDCGTEKIVAQANLSSGRAVSCGCFRAEFASAQHRTHGEAGNAHHDRQPSAEYNVWRWMKERCSNPGAESYPNYGGRGIKVCARWRDSFEAFLADMGRRPTAAHQIDRIDNNGDYKPGNCRWATRSQQQANTRRTRRTLQ